MSQTTRYSRQKYRDVNPSEVDAGRYPIAQLKFDGIWCGVEVSQAGELRYFSRNGQLKNTESFQHLPPGFYIGEYMYGSEWSKKEDRSGKLYLFDCTEFDGCDYSSKPYWQRHEHIRQLKLEGNLPRHWHLVANYPTVQLESIWCNFVETDKFEGLVFRSPLDPWNVEILRAKRDIQVDLRIIDYTEGTGKYAGSLGALVAVDGAGVIHTVGGGLTDKLRKDIWSNKERYRGRCFVCECKKIFESGKLRHPQFVEWHPDK